MLQRLGTTALDESTLFFKSLSLLNNALSAMDVSALVVDSLKNVVENKLHFPIGQEDILTAFVLHLPEIELGQKWNSQGHMVPLSGEGKRR